MESQNEVKTYEESAIRNEVMKLLGDKWKDSPWAGLSAAAKAIANVGTGCNRLALMFRNDWPYSPYPEDFTPAEFEKFYGKLSRYEKIDYVMSLICD